MNNAIGLVETKGLVGLVEATDAMAKAANSPAFKDLAAKKGFKIAPLGHKEFTDLLAAEDAKVKAIFASAGLLQSKSK